MTANSRDDLLIAPKKSGRWRIMLRIALLVAPVLVIPVAWFSVEVEKAARQKAAVEGIENSGGDVLYEHQSESDGNFDPLAPPPGPKWLRRLLGDDLFTTVVLADVYTDDGAAYLEQLPKLRRVHLLGPAITDSALLHVADLNELEMLTVARDLPITDRALGALTRLRHLKILYLSSRRITDAGLDRLRELVELTNLDLEFAQVSDAGIAKLQQALPHCTIRAIERAAK
jgi:hypothetical protein